MARPIKGLHGARRRERFSPSVAVTHHRQLDRERAEIILLRGATALVSKLSRTHPRRPRQRQGRMSYMMVIENQETSAPALSIPPAHSG
jgi:hypothetical protein